MSHYPEQDEEDDGFGIVLVALVVFTIFCDVAFGVFIYKVWNERVWRIEQHAAVVQEGRIADALERAYPAPMSNLSRMQKLAGSKSFSTNTLPTLGGTAVEP